MRLTGFEAIEFAERACRPLHKKADHIDEAVRELSIAEAEAIAESEPETIWLDVSKDEYYAGSRCLEPGRLPTRSPRRAGQREDELAPGENSGLGAREWDMQIGDASGDGLGDDRADALVRLDQQEDDDPMDGFDHPKGEPLREPYESENG